MYRRDFIRKVCSGTAALTLINLRTSAKTTDLPPYCPKLPVTPFGLPAGSWTLVLMPDTQNYSAQFPEVYQRQCEWIVAHRESHNILFVAHEGDIVHQQKPDQWRNAREAMSLLNKAQVPYALLPGNHDLGPLGHICQDRSTLLNDYFTAADYVSSPAFGLYEPDKMENSWHMFDTPTGPRLLLALEFGPRDSTVEWAAKVASRQPECKAVMVTHAYLYSDSTRYGEPLPGVLQKWSPKQYAGLQAVGGVNDGYDLWEKIVSRPPNFQFTFNGHVLNNGTGYLASPASDGHMVHQILANYQARVKLDDGAGGVAYRQVPAGTPEPPHDRAYGGGGFLRLIRHHADGRKVEIRSYSPWYDRWLTQSDHQFDVSLT